MGVRTQNPFGAAVTPEPALPGTYGVAPSGYRLPAATRLGAVHLQVADLARSVAYYTTVLGLRVLSRVGGHAVLAAHDDDRALVELHERAGAHPAGRRGQLGLYHFAVLLPDRPALGRFVRHLAEIGARAGAGDHLVSEAFYLQDPDGLGIEIYADRPRESWQRMGRELMMATDPVNVEDLVASAGDEPWTGMPAGTVMGHVHLHVGDLARASEFYSDALGLDRMVTRYPGALFLAAGGYHHHLGTNTWAGPSAAPPSEADARLLHWTIVLPSADDVNDVVQSVERAGFAVDRAGDGTAMLTDPWGTAVRIVATY